MSSLAEEIKSLIDLGVSPDEAARTVLADRERGKVIHSPSRLHNLTSSMSSFSQMLSAFIWFPNHLHVLLSSFAHHH
jgi:hypothetical protein